MKGWLIAAGAVVVLGVGYVGLAHVTGGAFPVPGLAVGGDIGDLRRQTLSFWEDIQFKDFDHAATWHDPAVQESVDIPYLLERIFVLKPEALDIMDIEIVLADRDSTGNRARVKTRLRFKDLVKGKVHEKEVILYWHRADAQAPWYMELESSLRRDEAEEGKAH